MSPDFLNNGDSRGRSFLRWAGSKKQLLPRLKVYWRNSFRRYVEPFMGSACLFFAIRPRRAILADMNEELVRTFLQVRDNPGTVASKLRRFPTGKEAYYEMRALRPEKLTPAEAAARFIYLNRFCFNGLYRTNKSGGFNVPYASSGTGQLPSGDLLHECANALKSASIKSGDFAETLSAVRAGDFVYLDPPFVVQKRRVFREYVADSFGQADLPRLTAMLKKIDLVGAFFVASYADCREGRQALAEWRQCRVRTKRHIAGFSKHRRHAYEIIATNLPDADVGLS